jgi:hypothetical protein
MGELLEDTDRGKVRILVELDRPCRRIAAGSWRAGMILRFNDFALANNFVAILGMLKLLRKIVGSTGLAAYEQTIFGQNAKRPLRRTASWHGH